MSITESNKRGICRKKYPPWRRCENLWRWAMY